MTSHLRAGRYIHRGKCLCVAFDATTRCRAIQALWSAAEVAHLWHAAPAGSYAVPVPLQVSAWLQDQFRFGGLQYLPDPEYCDEWCSPSRTLARGYGDCDDFAILTASMLEAGGLSVWVLVGQYGEQGHAWVEGYDEAGRPFMIEPTSGGLFTVRPHGYHPQLLTNPRDCQRAWVA